MKTDLEKLAVPFNSRGQIASVKWYKNQVRSLFEVTTPSSLMSNKDRLVSKIQPGKMYLYYYDPKYKETLPFYDTFPLVLPFDTSVNGFMGLNFHYLPYMLRLKLLENLMGFRNNKRMDETTKIMTSWKLLQGLSTHNLVKPAVKKYLTSHVGSRFLQIYPNEWATVIMLPVEQFQKATKQQVFNNSSKIIG